MYSVRCVLACLRQPVDSDLFTRSMSQPFIMTPQPLHRNCDQYTLCCILQVANEEGVKFRTEKLLSVDPTSYRDAPTEGIRRILEQETGIPHPRGESVDTSRIYSLRMGTTVRPYIASIHITSAAACKKPMQI